MAFPGIACEKNYLPAFCRLQSDVMYRPRVPANLLSSLECSWWTTVEYTDDYTKEYGLNAYAIALSLQRAFYCMDCSSYWLQVPCIHPQTSKGTFLQEVEQIETGRPTNTSYFRPSYRNPSESEKQKLLSCNQPLQ